MPQFAPMFHFNQTVFIIATFSLTVYYVSSYFLPAATRLQVARLFLISL